MTARSYALGYEGVAGLSEDDLEAVVRRQRHTYTYTYTLHTPRERERAMYISTIDMSYKESPDLCEETILNIYTQTSAN